MTDQAAPSAEPGSGSGTLTVVGTPIGNLADLSPRAAAALVEADAVVCEDTRRTGRLLAHIATDRASARRPDLLVANDHTELPRIAEVLDRLARGQRLALVTDAGMPTISDPGRHLVRAVADAGHPVLVVPGPTAVSAAVALSGLAVDRYVFEGFLPRKGRERTERLAQIGDERRAVVVYEAPHRLLRTLADLAAVCGGDRPVAVARELTKLYEEVVRDTLAGAGEHFRRTEPRGEFVLVIEGARERGGPIDDGALLDALRRHIEDGTSRRDAVAAVVKATGAPKRRVYDLATTL